MTDRVFYLEFAKKKIFHPTKGYEVSGYFTWEYGAAIKMSDEDFISKSSRPTLKDCLNEGKGTAADVEVAKSTNSNLIIKLGKTLSGTEFAEIDIGPFPGGRKPTDMNVVDKRGIRIFPGIRRSAQDTDIDPTKMFRVKANKSKIKIRFSEPYDAENEADHTVFKFDLFLRRSGNKGSTSKLSAWIDPIIRNDGGGGSGPS